MNKSQQVKFESLYRKHISSHRAAHGPEGMKLIERRPGTWMCPPPWVASDAGKTMLFPVIATAGVAGCPTRCFILVAHRAAHDPAP